ncbi:MAG: excinuclease ABC subunit A, partial [Bacteroidota bacterium]
MNLFDTFQPCTLDKKEIDQLVSQIHIKGANTNNLRDVELKIPKNQLVVVTGVSGSGKSSLVMDTLYAEGQRRYVESMSSYARQFLGRMKKPEVDFIKGISPAIAIEQKVTSSNARSTVGSLTEIYDYLRLLFARAGQTISPVSGKVVRRHEVADVVNGINGLPNGTKVILVAPIKPYDDERKTSKEFELLLGKGFSRLYWNDELLYIQDLLDAGDKRLDKAIGQHKSDIQVLIDRFVSNDDEENRKRIADSVNTAFYEGGGECHLRVVDGEDLSFNNRFELDGITFLEPSPQLFNYNNPYGACKKCEGYGQVLGIDPAKVIPNDALSVYEGAIACWKGEKNGMWLTRLIYAAADFGFPVHTPVKDLSEAERELLWTGNDHFEGINEFFEELQSKSYKIQNRVMMARYRGKTTCPVCKGGRLRKEASYVLINGKNISDLIHMPIKDLKDFIDHIELSKHQQAIFVQLSL